MPTVRTAAPGTTDSVDLCFVLYEPQQAGNVGAAARALATMGFNDLRLVNSCLQHHHQARVLAHGCRDVLAATRSFATLADALADTDLAVATTARQRHHRRYYHRPEELPDMLATKGTTVRRCALVFGREDSGLGNRELELCDAISSIPLAAPFPSLNLGQAVMLYAYWLQPLARPPAGVETPGPGELRALKARVAELLGSLDQAPDAPMFGWAMERLATLQQDDVRFLHLLCREIERRLPAGGEGDTPT